MQRPTINFKLTDNDFYYGPLIYGRLGQYGKLLRLTWESFNADNANYLVFYAVVWAFALRLPNILRAKSVNNCESLIDRCYGFTVSAEYSQIHYGLTNTGHFWPWNQWILSEYRYYGLHGEMWKSCIVDNEDDYYSFRYECPTADFEVQDQDGRILTARTLINERQFRRGTGWFSWLRYVCPDLTRRRLDVVFLDPVTEYRVGVCDGFYETMIQLNDGELHESGIRRLCEESRSLTYLRPTWLTSLRMML